jgi:hypothetical protein
MSEVEHEIDFDENANIVLKKKVNVKKGSKSRASGAQFERRVRKDLEEKRWIVDKWSNNLDLENNKIIPAKRLFKRFKNNMGVMTIGTGFPDFICLQKMDNYYKIVGVEVKINGKLRKEEKEKCAWYLKNKTFNEVWIAKKEKEGRKIKVVYENFEEIYPKFLV